MTEEFSEYSLENTHQGKRWSVNLQATSFEDAEERAKALQYAEVSLVEGTIPASSLSSAIHKWTKFSRSP